MKLILIISLFATAPFFCFSELSNEGRNFSSCFCTKYLFNIYSILNPIHDIICFRQLRPSKATKKSTTTTIMTKTKTASRPMRNWGSLGLKKSLPLPNLFNPLPCLRLPCPLLALSTTSGAISCADQLLRNACSCIPRTLTPVRTSSCVHPVPHVPCARSVLRAPYVQRIRLGHQCARKTISQGMTLRVSKFPFM